MDGSYRDLHVWQKAMDFVVDCYGAAKQFPRIEEYGLASQLRRSAVSVPANIAEGQGRIHRKEFLHHLSIAYGSLMEAETHLQLAVRLEYLVQEDAEGMLGDSSEIGRMLNGLMKSLQGRKRTASAARPSKV